MILYYTKLFRFDHDSIYVHYGKIVVVQKPIEENISTVIYI